MHFFTIHAVNEDSDGHSFANPQHPQALHEFQVLSFTVPFRRRTEWMERVARRFVAQFANCAGSFRARKIV
jgi:hypothetical protein